MVVRKVFMTIKRKHLKPGMFLQNTVSENCGEVRGDPKKSQKLRTAHPSFVAVRVLDRETGKYQYPYWNLSHVEIIPSYALGAFGLA